MSGEPPENEVGVMLNRSAVVVKPKQPFLDWLHRADPTSGEITLDEVGQEPTIYLIPECDTKDAQEQIWRTWMPGEASPRELSFW